MLQLIEASTEFREDVLLEPKVISSTGFKADYNRVYGLTNDFLVKEKSYQMTVTVPMSFYLR